MRFQIGTQTVEADLVVFDKDGTLVDLHAPWGQWAEAIAASLAPHIPPEQFLCRLGWNASSRRIEPETPLAIASQVTLQAVIATWLYEAGQGWSEAMTTAAQAITHVETPPAPPICPLAPLFQTLAARAFKLGVVTTDERAGVERDLGPHGVLSYLNVIVGADAKVATKPAPDMLLMACAAVAVPPARTIVVGDSVADLLMGRAAGAALVVGVLSGGGTMAHLAPHADVVLPSVADLLALIA